MSGVSATAGQAALNALAVHVAITFEDQTFGGLSISRLTIVGGGKLNTIDLVTPRSARFAAAIMQRPIRGSLDDQELAIVSPEDFVVLKVLATRDHDLEDARTVMRALSGRLDTDLIAAEASTLAAEISDHDVLGRYRAII